MILALLITTFLGMVSDNVLIAVFGGIITLGVAAIGPVVTIIMFFLKERSDEKARKQASEEAKAARSLMHEKIAAVGAKVDVVEVKADASYKEANNVNLKLESMGIQTKPQLGESAENPVHVTTP